MTSIEETAGKNTVLLSLLRRDDMRGSFPNGFTVKNYSDRYRVTKGAAAKTLKRWAASGFVSITKEAVRNGSYRHRYVWSE